MKNFWLRVQSRHYTKKIISFSILTQNINPELIQKQTRLWETVGFGEKCKSDVILVCESLFQFRYNCFFNCWRIFIKKLKVVIFKFNHWMETFLLKLLEQIFVTYSGQHNFYIWGLLIKTYLPIQWFKNLLYCFWILFFFFINIAYYMVLFFATEIKSTAWFVGTFCLIECS